MRQRRAPPRILLRNALLGISFTNEKPTSGTNPTRERIGDDALVEMAPIRGLKPQLSLIDTRGSVSSIGYRSPYEIVKPKNIQIGSINEKLAFRYLPRLVIFYRTFSLTAFPPSSNARSAWAQAWARRGHGVRHRAARV